jgi:hypothetical protein
MRCSEILTEFPAHMLVFLFIVLFAIGLLCAVVLLVWSIVVVRKYWSSPALWQSLEVTVPSAVLSALIFGLIVGLSIYYLQHSEDTQERMRAEQQQTHLARERIVSLLRRELSYDLEAIRARRQAADLNAAFVQIYQKPLKIDFWHSISSTGDLKFLNDFDLLYKVADAYFGVNATMGWEEKLANVISTASRAVTVAGADGKSVSLVEVVFGLASQSYSGTEAALVEAIGALDRAVPEGANITR